MKQKHKKDEGPRIYNLFPRLLGPISEWDKHITRIYNMGFNWIYVNPINYTGFSNSLYSIKNYFRMNPMFAENEEDERTWGSLKTFIAKCHVLGIKFMFDLVINHTAIDSILVDDHLSWYKQKWAVIDIKLDQAVQFYEEKDEIPMDQYPEDRYEIKYQIANPFAIDPADARKITIWGDLAEINYECDELDDIMVYWKRLLDFYDLLGVDGYRCDAAYQVESKIWQDLIDHSKLNNSKVLFIAETLGCTINQCEAIAKVGFDYIFNSSKWWDFTQPWAVEQYNTFRELSPSISFPESHDTERLAEISQGRVDIQQFRYVFAAFFSAGILMPLGYEYGFKNRMNVVTQTPADWESIHFDISEFISKVHTFKKAYKTLNQEGKMTMYDHSGDILVLKRTSEDETQEILLIYNKNWNNDILVNISSLSEYFSFNTPIFRLSLEREPQILENYELKRNFIPNEYEFYLQNQ